MSAPDEALEAMARARLPYFDDLPAHEVALVLATEKARLQALAAEGWAVVSVAQHTNMIHEAENRGAREMRERILEFMANDLAEAIRLLPLPHPSKDKQEGDDA